MKKLLTILFFMPLVAIGQDSLLYSVFPMTDGSISYQKTIDITSAPKETVYNRAKAWLLSNTVSKNSSLQEDKETGLLQADGTFSQSLMLPPRIGHDSVKAEWQYLYHITIYTKDNKAKIIIDNVRFTGISADNPIKLEEYKAQLETIHKNLSQKYKQSYLAAADRNLAISNKQFLQLLDDFVQTMQKG